MRYCEKCLMSDSDSKKFCTKCGRELTFYPRCKFCGNEIHPFIHKFCSFCGRPADADAETETPR